MQEILTPEQCGAIGFRGGRAKVRDVEFLREIPAHHAVVVGAITDDRKANLQARQEASASAQVANKRFYPRRFGVRTLEDGRLLILRLA